ncbi:Helix-turn-helix domain-containing protein, partial [Prauserella alba]|nr:Helix-turn-helix domain-containing protein [Prauserella alba]
MGLSVVWDVFCRVLDGEGGNVAAASRAVGVHRSTGLRWVRAARAGGYNPVVSGDGSLAAVQAELHPRFLTLPERERIADLRREGMSLRGIARVLGRSAS